MADTPPSPPNVPPTASSQVQVLSAASGPVGMFVRIVCRNLPDAADQIRVAVEDLGGRVDSLALYPTDAPRQFCELRFVPASIPAVGATILRLNCLGAERN